MNKTLKDQLQDWVDTDIASYCLGISLGLFDPNRKEIDGVDESFATGVKWVFWSDNPLGNSLFGMIDQMVMLGILEENQQEQVRWNNNWKPE